MSGIKEQFGTADLDEKFKQLIERTSCSVTVGDGLVVYGSIEAVGRVQDYILLDSTHPVEAEDVRRSLARQLQAAEAKIARLQEMIAKIHVEACR